MPTHILPQPSPITPSIHVPGPEPGLTRDANSAWAEWRGMPVQLVDTAGWVKKAASLAQHDDVGGAVAAMTQAQVRVWGCWVGAAVAGLRVKGWAVWCSVLGCGTCGVRGTRRAMQCSVLNVLKYSTSGALGRGWAVRC